MSLPDPRIAAAPGGAGLVAAAEATVVAARSALGRRWTLRPVSERAVLACAQRWALPEPLARVVCGRGVALEDVGDWLQPKLRALLPDPSRLLDMDAAVERLVAAIGRGETIGLLGDYDVDGLAGTALMAGYLAGVGAPSPVVHIPDRLEEGYGPSVAGIERLRAAGASVLVTIDCGVTAFAPLEHAARLGLATIVLDHHSAEPRLPAALAVVNPNRLDETFADKTLAAVGVVFLVLVALNRRLRQLGWFNDTRPEPDLMAALDLVALGTVADVVPLRGLNRAFVVQGLRRLAQRRRPGLTALCDVTRLDRPPSAHTLGYILGPRINAGGRLGHVAQALALLQGEDPAQAVELATLLDQLNRQRQAIEQQMVAEALAMARVGDDATTPVVIAAGEGWHPGVVGLVAARLKEQFQRPALAIAWEGMGGEALGAGSARSVTGVDIGAAVIAARQAGLLESGGGHPMAAGLKVRRPRLEALAQFLGDHVRDQARGRPLAPDLALDGVLSPGGASLDLARSLARCQPCGAGNPAPRFAVTGVVAVDVQVMKDAHLRCRLRAPGAGPDLSAVAFRVVGTPVVEPLLAGRPLAAAGCLEINSWNDTDRVQFVIDDVAEG